MNYKFFKAFLRPQKDIFIKANQVLIIDINLLFHALKEVVSLKDV